MNYWYILRRAWQVTWQHKVLWLLGLLAGLSTQLQLNLGNEATPLRHWVAELALEPSFRPVAIGAAQVFVFATLLFSVLRALGRSGMIHRVNQVERGDTPTARSGWQAALRHGGPVFGIAFLLELPALILVLVGLVPAIAPLVLLALGPASAWRGSTSVFEPWSRALIYTMPVWGLGLLLGEFLGVLGALAERECVLRDRLVQESIAGGWRMLRDRPGPVTGLWLILLALRVGLLILFLPLTLLLAPLLAPTAAMLRSLEFSAPLSGVVGYLSLAALTWALGLAVGCVAEPFLSGCWTLAYRQLAGLEQPSEETATALARLDESSAQTT
jgi:hypothetical protein